MSIAGVAGVGTGLTKKQELVLSGLAEKILMELHAVVPSRDPNWQPMDSYGVQSIPKDATASKKPEAAYCHPPNIAFEKLQVGDVIEAPRYVSYVHIIFKLKHHH
jgi:hypothetical protein